MGMWDGSAVLLHRFRLYIADATAALPPGPAAGYTLQPQRRILLPPIRGIGIRNANER